MRLGLAIAALLLAAPGTVFAGDSAKESLAETAERFGGSSVLYENSWSVGHGANFDPVATRSWSMLFSAALDLQVTEHLGFSISGSFQRFILEENTTFKHELWASDTLLALSLALPAFHLEGAKEALPIAAAIGLDVSLPTSKASQAESLIMEFAPYVEHTVTVPLLDGWSWTHRMTVTPRLHRYTTMQFAVLRVCSAATGCTLGATTDTGWLNTKLQMTQGISTSLAMLDSMITLTAGIDATWGWLYAKSPSDQYAESAISDPANNGGTPTNLTSAFILDLTIAPNDAFSVGVGLWTPGGMNPSGGWYNPFGNRWSQVYLDLTFYPVGFGQTVAQARAE